MCVALKNFLFWVSPLINDEREIKLLLIDFDKKASKFCLSTGTGRFNVFKRKVDVKEIDETPAFGLNPVYKLGIDGIIICK